MLGARGWELMPRGGLAAFGRRDLFPDSCAHIVLSPLPFAAGTIVVVVVVYDTISIQLTAVIQLYPVAQAVPRTCYM